MYGFAGRSFNFIGDPGKTYNIISTQNLQARPASASGKLLSPLTVAAHGCHAPGGSCQQAGRRMQQPGMARQP